MDNSSEHIDYLNSVYENGLISKSVLCSSLFIWSQVMDKVSVPVACTGPDRQMFYSWNHDGFSLEVDIFDDKSEWFYRDRDAEKTWLVEQRFLGSIPEEVTPVLGLFSR